MTRWKLLGAYDLQAAHAGGHGPLAIAGRRLRRSDRIVVAITLLAAIAAVVIGVLEIGARRAFADTTTVLGDSGGNFAGANRCRGAKIQADHDAVVLGFDLEAANTRGHRLTFYAYEGRNADSKLRRIEWATRNKAGTLGSDFGWESSPPMQLPVRNGRVYALVACWDASSDVGYRSKDGVAPQPLPFGTYLGGTAVTGQSAPPASMAWSTSNSDYSARIRSTVGSVLVVDTRGGYSAPAGPADEVSPGNDGKAGRPGNEAVLRGDVYDVDADVTLVGFEQLVAVTGDATVQWYVYRCTHSAACDEGSPGWALEKSGTIPVDGSQTGKRWLTVDGIGVGLHAGNRYWVGIGWKDAAVASVHFASPKAKATWGHLDGYWVDDGKGASTTGFVRVADSALPQHLLTYDAVVDSERMDNPAVYKEPWRHGNVFLATRNTRIHQVAWPIDPHYAGHVTFGIYRSKTRGGEYERVWSRELVLAAADGDERWVESGPIETDLTSGTYYLFAVAYDATHRLSYTESRAYKHPVDFGLRVGAYNQAGDGLPETIVTKTDTYIWSYRIESCASCADIDGDGYASAVDCNDADAAVHPDAKEVCNGADDDCNGVVDEGFDADGDGVTSCAGDCDDGNPAVAPKLPEICDQIDNDCDGEIDEGFDHDGDGVTACAGDCDDDDPHSFPGAPEACDQLDNDCDGSVDEGFDADGDGVTTCQQDCDDHDASIGPGKPEQCDGKDDDCNGVKDDVADADGDGVTTCQGDCNDEDATVHPGAPEKCDRIDSDCDGDLVDTFTDADGDGDPSCTDCNDADAGVHTGATEACDSIDSDCNGSLVDGFEDFDHDGTPDCVDADADDDGDPALTDCNDHDPAIHAGAEESCDAIDSNCDGSLVDSFDDLDGDGTPDCVDADVDGDGDPAATDCNDADTTVFTGAPERCDLIDSNCDGSLVDSFDDLDGDGTPDCVDPDDDGDGYADADDCGPLDATVFEGAEESCDDLDSDCDGSRVDGFPDSDGDGVPDCVDVDVDGDGDPNLSDCAPDDASIHAGADEDCDLVDSNCNGDLDDGFPDLDADGTPDCVDTDADGDGETADTDCNDHDAAIYTGAEESCDAVDSDCDGDVIDDFGDRDGDGTPDCFDCGPDDPAIHPGAAEICDGKDDDCDGNVGPGEVDADHDGQTVCGGDCDDDNATVHAGAEEICDGRDTDCDGVVPTAEQDLDGDGFGGCADCNDGDVRIHPNAIEICDGRDSDCDGLLPANEVDTDGDGYIACLPSRSVVLPSGIVGGSDCDDDDATINPGAVEVCDGRDTNCDGTIAADEQDADADGVPACRPDNCPNLANPDQSDCDGDGIGDACDTSCEAPACEKNGLVQCGTIATMTFDDATSGVATASSRGDATSADY